MKKAKSAKGQKVWSGSRLEKEKLFPKQLTVNITGEDIEEGIERDPGHCVVQCSIKREHPDWKHISVDASTIRYTRTQKDGTRLRCVHFTPRALARVVIATDQGMKKYLKPLRAIALAAQVTVSNPPGRPKASARRKRKAIAALRRKPVLRSRGGHNVPVVIGGKELPQISSQRRAFGKRGMQM